MRKRKYTEPVGVLFSQHTYEKLIRITDELEISVSKFIRSIVEEKINKRTKEDENV